MKLTFAAEAAADLDEIWEFSLQKWGPSRTGEYVARLVETAEALAAGALSGTVANDIRPALRRQVAGSHVIWFRLEPGALRVVRILHQSRDAGRWIP